MKKFGFILGRIILNGVHLLEQEVLEPDTEHFDEVEDLQPTHARIYIAMGTFPI